MSQICGLGVVWIALKSVRLFSKAVIELLGRLKIPILESQNLMALKKNAHCNFTKKKPYGKKGERLPHLVYCWMIMKKENRKPSVHLAAPLSSLSKREVAFEEDFFQSFLKVAAQFSKPSSF